MAARVRRGWLGEVDKETPSPGAPEPPVSGRDLAAVGRLGLHLLQKTEQAAPFSRDQEISWISG